MKLNHPAVCRCGWFLWVSNNATAGVSKPQHQTPPHDASSIWQKNLTPSNKVLVCVFKKKIYHINCFFWSSSVHRIITLNYSVAFSCGAPHWLLKELRSSETNEKSFGSGVMDYLHSHIYMYFIKIHLLQWTEPQLWLMLALLQLLLCQTILTLSWVEWSWFMIYSDALVVLPGAKFAQSMVVFFSNLFPRCNILK